MMQELRGERKEQHEKGMEELKSKYEGKSWHEVAEEIKETREKDREQEQSQDPEHKRDREHELEIEMEKKLEKDRGFGFER